MMDGLSLHTVYPRSRLENDDGCEDSVASYLLKEIDLLSQSPLHLDHPPVKGGDDGVSQASQTSVPTLVTSILPTCCHDDHDDDDVNQAHKSPMPHIVCDTDPTFGMTGIPCASLASDGCLEGFDLVAYADCCRDTTVPDVLQGLDCQMADMKFSECGNLLPASVAAADSLCTAAEWSWTRVKERRRPQQVGGHCQDDEGQRENTCSAGPGVTATGADSTASQPKRPKNGFLRFSTKYRREIAKRHPRMDNRDISRLLGAKWRKMTVEEKRPYELEFAEDIQKIRDKNPRWRYAPARYFQHQLIEPMPDRLRPRDKLKRKKYEDFACAWRPFKRRKESGNRHHCHPLDTSNYTANSCCCCYLKPCQMDEDCLSCGWRQGAQLPDSELLTVGREERGVMDDVQHTFCCCQHKSTISSTDIAHADYLML